MGFVKTTRSLVLAVCVGLSLVSCEGDDDGDSGGSGAGLTGDTLWTRVYGTAATEWCFIIHPTSDGGFLCGGGQYAANVQQPYFVKISADGAQEWTRLLNDSVSIYAIANASTGGYVAVGHNGLGKTKLIKMDSQCIREWSRAFDLGDPGAIGVMPDGGYVFGGGVSNAAKLIRTTSSGDTLWTRRYLREHNARVTDLRVLSNGSIVLGGVNVGVGGWLMEITPDGEPIWEQSYEGKQVYGMTVTSSGYALVGNSGDGAALQLALTSVTAGGDVRWSKTFGGSSYDRGSNVVEMPDGSLIIVGTTQSFGQGVPDYANLWVLRTSAAGDSLWSRILGGESDESGSALARTSDGVIIGGEANSWGAGQDDFYIIRMK